MYICSREVSRPNMGVEDLLPFLEARYPELFESVDLLTSDQMSSDAGTQPAVFVMDAESCLHKLYSGYYTDWVGGGQWARMTEFLTQLIGHCQKRRVRPLIAFDGAAEEEGIDGWKRRQEAKSSRVRQTLCHVRLKGTPPPKAYWLPPEGLRTALRLAARRLGLPVLQSVRNHRQELSNAARGFRSAPLIASSAEYIFLDSGPFVQSESLKLTYDGLLNCRRLGSRLQSALDVLAAALDLKTNKMALLAALLGNSLLTEADLRGFHEELTVQAPEDQKHEFSVLFNCIAAFVRNLSADNVCSDGSLTAIGRLIFRQTSLAGSSNSPSPQPAASFGDDADEVEKAAVAEKIRRLIRAVQFYSNREKQGACGNSSSEDSAVPTSTSVADERDLQAVVEQEEDEKKTLPAGQCEESVEQESIPVLEESGTSGYSEQQNCSKAASGATISLSSVGAALLAAQNEAAANPQLLRQTESKLKISVTDDLVAICRQRHVQGFMHPWILQILTKNEVRVEAALDDGSEVEGGFRQQFWQIFRPLRQAVYGVLFDLNRKPTRNRKSSQQFAVNQRVAIEEWFCDLSLSTTSGSVQENELCRRETVFGASPSWRTLPSLATLWLGGSTRDMAALRLRAFLHCLNADTPLMVNTEFVEPKHLLPCAVLRYLVSRHEAPLLRLHELDCFLAVAVSPLLGHPKYCQELPIAITSRGVHLSQLFMCGVDHAVLANDACGAPVPFEILQPLLFFDGKIFQSKLAGAKAFAIPTLSHICGGETDQMAKVERMRSAVLEGMDFGFVARQLSGGGVGESSAAASSVAAGCQMMEAQRVEAALKGRGMIGRRELLGRGGRLEIAGQVVAKYDGERRTAASPLALIAGSMALQQAPPRLATMPPPPTPRRALTPTQTNSRLTTPYQTVGGQRLPLRHVGSGQSASAHRSVPLAGTQYFVGGAVRASPNVGVSRLSLPNYVRLATTDASGRQQRQIQQSVAATQLIHQPQAALSRQQQQYQQQHGLGLVQQQQQRQQFQQRPIQAVVGQQQQQTNNLNRWIPSGNRSGDIRRVAENYDNCLIAGIGRPRFPLR